MKSGTLQKSEIPRNTLQDERDAAARKALSSMQPPPPPLGLPKDVLAGQMPVLRVPEGVPVSGACAF